MEEKYPKGHQRGTPPTGSPFGNPSAMARRGPAGPLAGHPPKGNARNRVLLNCIFFTAHPLAPIPAWGALECCTLVGTGEIIKRGHK